MRANRVLLMFTILAFLVFAGCSGGSPKGTVDAFIAAGKAGDMAKMKSLCTSDLLKVWDKIDEISKKMGDDKTIIAEKFKNVVEVKVEEKSIEGDTAKVDATIDGTTTTFVLTKTGGAWLISDMMTVGVSITDVLKQMEKVEEMVKGAPGGFGLSGVPQMQEGDTDE